jgi:hypothetical protein
VIPVMIDVVFQNAVYLYTWRISDPFYSSKIANGIFRPFGNCFPKFIAHKSILLLLALSLKEIII